MRIFSRNTITSKNGNSPSQWNNRKYMAWAALLSTIAVMGIVLFYLSDDKIKTVSTIIEWFFTLMASVVGAYMGFSTWHDVVETKKTSVDETFRMKSLRPDTEEEIDASKSKR